jgi:hypothetical protein
MAKARHNTEGAVTMTIYATHTAPKIVGKALYLELVPNLTDHSEDEARKFLGWQFGGTKQVILFPQYQDDSGKTHEAVVMVRTVSSYQPKAQWDFTFLSGSRLGEADLSRGDDYVNYPHLNHADWTALSDKERHDSMKRALAVMLKNQMISTSSEWVGEERVYKAGQGWEVREGKPISVEITDQDMSDLHDLRKTPQAVIRRINKVRESLDKFPAKLA